MRKIEGNLIIRSQADAKKAADVESVGGHLSIGAEGAQLPVLASVGGYMVKPKAESIAALDAALVAGAGVREVTPLDLIVLFAVFVFVALLAAILNPPGLIAWLREEWRLARADTWADGSYRGAVGTSADPDVKRMEARQRAFGERLRRQGRSLLAGKEYVPSLTKPAEPPPPPRANKVVRLRAAGGKR